MPVLERPRQRTLTSLTSVGEGFESLDSIFVVLLICFGPEYGN